jgi:hypothetical protein
MTTHEDLQQRIEAIETGYEFMLAYAAQGRATDKGAAAGRNVREYLEKMVTGLDGLAAAIERRAAEVDAGLGTTGAPFFAAVAADAAVALGMLKLVLARPDVSSQLIDNVNASIHLRALLTDLFVVDELLKTPK